MANITSSQGDCPAPFLQLSNFPYRGGCAYFRSLLPSIENHTNVNIVEASRLCAPIPSPHGPVSCCLPCPLTDWVYPDSMSRLYPSGRRSLLTVDTRLHTSYKCRQLAQCRQSDMLRFTATIVRYTSGSADPSTLSHCMLDNWCSTHVCMYWPNGYSRPSW